MATESEEVIGTKINKKNFTEKGFAKNILSNIHDLMKNGEFCDIVLHVGNRDFNAHKVVLASASPYFSAMFRGDMSEKFQEKVYIYKLC